MINELFNDAKDRMNKAIEHFRHEVASIRTGRASSSILDGVKVDYYGTPTPINNIAHITVPEGQLIVIQPFDPKSLEIIEKAIISSDVGLTPNNDSFKEIVELDKWGFVATRDNLETSADGILAAGDVRANSTKQVASAVGEGATAALMIR